MDKYIVAILIITILTLLVLGYIYNYPWMYGFGWALSAIGVISSVYEFYKSRQLYIHNPDQLKFNNQDDKQNGDIETPREYDEEYDEEYDVYVKKENPNSNKKIDFSSKNNMEYVEF